MGHISADCKTASEMACRGREGHSTVCVGSDDNMTDGESSSFSLSTDTEDLAYESMRRTKFKDPSGSKMQSQEVIPDMPSRDVSVFHLALAPAAVAVDRNVPAPTSTPPPPNNSALFETGSGTHNRRRRILGMVRKCVPDFNRKSGVSRFMSLFARRKSKDGSDCEHLRASTSPLVPSDVAHESVDAQGESLSNATGASTTSTTSTGPTGYADENDSNSMPATVRASLSPSSAGTFGSDETVAYPTQVSNVDVPTSQYRMRRKRTVAACRVLQAQIQRFEAAFVQLHGRLPNGATDRAPLAITYAQYIEWQRALQANAACQIQALFWGAACRWRLLRTKFVGSIKEAIAVPEISGEGSTSAMGISNMSLADLQARKRDLEQQIKQYDLSFSKKYGRMPAKSEKEPIRFLYESYHTLKKHISLLEADGQHPLPGTPTPPPTKSSNTKSRLASSASSVQNETSHSDRLAKANGKSSSRTFDTVPQDRKAPPPSSIQASPPIPKNLAIESVDTHDENLLTPVGGDIYTLLERQKSLIHELQECIKELRQNAIHSRGAMPLNVSKSSLPGVVLVGVLDLAFQRIVSVGSGFIVDAGLGLIVSAAHTLFHMEPDCEEDKYGTLKGSHRAVVGIVPEGENKAHFRYIADLAAQDNENVDACVLRISSRIKKGSFRTDATNQSHALEEKVSLPEEKLPSLEMADNYLQNDIVRIVGFNQGGAGLLELGKHICLSPEFATGIICGNFSAADCIDHGGAQRMARFSPRAREVVVDGGWTIRGQSGGPCLDKHGKIVGCLSRAHEGRSYVVPTSEIKALVDDARSMAAAEQKP